MSFNFDTGNPADGSVVAVFPANERTFRTTTQSWVQTEHDLNGRHVIGSGSVAARNAITTFGVGNLWFNTDTTPATLQRCTATGTPATFENIGANATVVGPGSSTNNAIVLWNGTTGGILKDSTFLIGTAANNIVQLDGSARLPAVDASQLTNLAFGMAVFNASGTYTPATGVSSVYVKCLGSGGGGGGCAAGGASGGGGAGAYAEGIVAVTPGVGVTVTIAGAGAGGAAGDNDGTDGGNTSFGSSVIAVGGQHGSKGSVRTGGGGGQAGSCTGTLTITGGPGQNGTNNATIPGASGGSSAMGGGPEVSGGAAGVNAQVAGCGGSGTVSGSTSLAGGNGAAGVCIVIALR